VAAVALQGAALADAIVFQVEYYLSRDNLSRDAYLKSQMDSDQYVALELLASFKKLKLLSSDLSVIREALRSSRLVELDADESRVKPRGRPQRNTIILREMPADTQEAEVRALFSGADGPAVSQVRAEVGDNWFVVLESETAALEALNWLRGQMFRGEAVRARMKTESTMLRSYFVPGGGTGVARPVVPFVPSGAYYPASQNSGVSVSNSGGAPWDYVPAASGGNSSRPQGNNRDRDGRERNKGGQQGRQNRKGSPNRGAKSTTVAPVKKAPRPEPELTLAQFPPLAAENSTTATLASSLTSPPSVSSVSVSPSNSSSSSSSASSSAADSNVTGSVSVGHYVAPKPGGGYGGRRFTRYGPEVLGRVVSASASGSEAPPSLLADLRTATTGL
jgi:hypothetical protein